MAAGEPARMHRLQQELRRAWNVVRKTRTPARGDTSTPRKATLAARMGARSRAARECADRRQSRKGDANMLLCGGPVKTNPSIAFLGGWQSAQLWVARFCQPQQNRDASSDVATPPPPHEPPDASAGSPPSTTATGWRCPGQRPSCPGGTGAGPRGLGPPGSPGRGASPRFGDGWGRKW